jgi:hypothetical protein
MNRNLLKRVLPVGAIVLSALLFWLLGPERYLTRPSRRAI